MATQQQNLANNNTSNFNYDVGICRSNLALNNAQRAQLGMSQLPDTCDQNTYGLTPAGTTGGVNIQAGNAPQYIESTTPIAPTAPTPGTYPATSGGGSPGAGLSFTNLTTGDNSHFNVGDRWQIQITGAAPNAPVSVSGGLNGVNNSSQMGTTNSAGAFSMNGQITADQIGSWQETWKVGGAQVSSYSFVVNPSGSASGSGTGTSSGTGTPTGGSVTGSISDLLSKTTTIGGTSIPDWALIGGALVVLFLVMKK